MSISLVAEHLFLSPMLITPVDGKLNAINAELSIKQDVSCMIVN
jgi:hypothetical protein